MRWTPITSRASASELTITTSSINADDGRASNGRGGREMGTRRPRAQSVGLGGVGAVDGC